MSKTTSVNTLANNQPAERHLANASEPDWLKTNRSLAWEAYLQTPLPSTRDEHWRKIDLNAYDLSQPIALNFGPVQKVMPSLPDWFASSVKSIGQTAGIFFQAVDSPGYIELSPELRAKGVIFADLAVAIQKHEDKIRPYLIRQSMDPTDNKFLLMNQALFNGGFFLYIPKDVVIEAPLITGLGFSSKDSDTKCSVITPLVIIVAEANSQVEIVHINGAMDNTADVSQNGNLSKGNFLLVAGAVDMCIGGGAKVSYLEIDDLPSNVLSINTNRAEIFRAGELNSLNVALGGKHTKTDIVTQLQEPGACSEVLGLILGDQNEQFSFNTIQEHNAPDTTSDINFRVALKDAAVSVYQGIIKVAKSAQRTNAYQQNKNLLLGSSARADSIPKLEILADDVKCSHGATVGPVDKEQVFYLQSRGLSQEQAEELIVMGFFGQVIEKFALPNVATWLYDNITKRIRSFK